MSVCPKCGRDGKRGVKRVHSKGKEYWYEVWRHADGSTCIVRRLDESEVAKILVPRSRLAYELRGARFLLDYLLVRLMERELEMHLVGESLRGLLDRLRWQGENIRRLLDVNDERGP